MLQDELDKELLELLIAVVDAELLKAAVGLREGGALEGFSLLGREVVMDGCLSSNVSAP